MHRPKRLVHIVIAFLVLAVLPATAHAVDRPYPVTEKRADCASYEPLKRPLFGDTHVHTSYSFDAASQDTRNTPRDAYRFARGEEVGLQPYDAEGNALRKAQLRRPLDWAMVSDHMEALGEVRICKDDPSSPAHSGDFCWMYRNFGPIVFNFMAVRQIVGKQRWAFCGEGDELCLAAAAAAWTDVQAAANEAYDRSEQCSFTSFIGYEWTASLQGGQNLHHNVVFRNEKVPKLPPSWLETPSADALFQTLQADCVDDIDGCDALTIPHNSNLSGQGLIFAAPSLSSPADVDKPITKEEAERRQRWEPLAEIMQHKGDSECLLGGDTTDEACGFEKLPYNSFAGVGRFRQLNLGAELAPTPKGMVRAALKTGLLEQQSLGVNSLKYGIIASTDTHLGTPGFTAEADSSGHGGAGMQAGLGATLPDDLEFNPGGLAVVWAEENTRDSIFAAMQRREAYGTSGTRPVVRLFGGRGYDASMCGADDFVERGYAGGVPMGGDLPAGEGAPTLAVWAMQDPGAPGAPGTPLQRIQIVKGWVEDGIAKEQVFEVAGGANGASVDLDSCETSGPGSADLCAVWSDPDFDDASPAFYYARVLENPTCRWSQRVCNAAKVDCSDPASVPPGLRPCCSPDHRRSVQERAWTSPIWHTP